MAKAKKKPAKKAAKKKAAKAKAKAHTGASPFDGYDFTIEIFKVSKLAVAEADDANYRIGCRVKAAPKGMPQFQTELGIGVLIDSGAKAKIKNAIATLEDVIKEAAVIELEQQLIASGAQG